jgi:hypothetical protein
MMPISSTLARRWLFPFLCGALLLAAGCRVSLNAQPLPDRRDFAGRVLDDDGKPLAGATVTIRPLSDLGVGAFWGAQTVTDSDGEFRIPDAEDGKYSLTVEQSGFAPLQDSSFVLGRDTAHLETKLVRLVDFKLRVLKADGKPLAGSSLSVLLQGQELKLPSLNKRGSTDADGVLLLSGLVPGRYAIQLIAPETGYAVVPPLDINRTTVGTTPDAHLQPGGQLQIAARRQGEGGAGAAALGGAVLAISSLPDGAAANQSRPPEDIGLFLAVNNRYHLVTDESGALHLDDVPPGRYATRLLMPGFETPAAQEVEVKSGGETKLEFAFPAAGPSATLQMTLLDAEDKPLANAGWRLMLRPISVAQGGAPPALPAGAALPPALLMGGYMRRGQTDKDGRVVLNALAPGSWQCVLSLAPEKGGRRAPPITQTVDVPDKGGAATFKFQTTKP